MKLVRMSLNHYDNYEMELKQQDVKHGYISNWLYHPSYGIW